MEFKKRVVPIIVCQRCFALCKVGHDDDFQEFCANCHFSFPIEFENVMLIKEATLNSMKNHRDSGWEAWTKD